MTGEELGIYCFAGIIILSIIGSLILYGYIQKVRICENCKHINSTGSYHLCLNPEIEDYLRVKLDFGCNKWRKKR